MNKRPKLLIPIQFYFSKNRGRRGKRGYILLLNNLVIWEISDFGFEKYLGDVKLIRNSK